MLHGLAGTLAGRHMTAPHPRALTGPQGSKQWPLGLCLRRGPGLPKGPSDIHQTWDVYQTLLYVLPGPKSQRVGSRRRKGKSPDPTMPDPSEMGRRTPPVL